MSGNRGGHGAVIRYPNDRWWAGFEYNSFGDGFDPALGFLPRRGIKSYEGGVTFSPRPSPTGRLRAFRQITTENYVYLAKHRFGRTQTFEGFFAPVRVLLESGDSLSLAYVPNEEFLERSFAIASGVTIPAGNYHFDRVRLRVSTSQHRRVRAEAILSNGTFYGGHLRASSAFVEWASRTGRLTLRTEAENNFARLPFGNFTQRLWQQRAEYALNPNLVLSLYGQYDNQSQNVGLNNRLRWTIQPGRDLFVVWNRGWQRSMTARRDLNLTPDTEFVRLKLRWTLRY